jgi:light-regulated signal transduction histidine kinase (bacteriophytochrome)
MSKNEEHTEGQQAKPKGRPKKEIDVAVLKHLCEIQCTLTECAHVLGVSTDTLKRNYADVIQMGKSQGMQIWLGKNILGQTDSPLDDDAGTILPWTD